MRQPKRLTSAFVRTTREVGRHGDGRGSCGLTLLVHRAATGGVTKSWVQRIRLGTGNEPKYRGKGSRKTRYSHVGLGPFPQVGLSAAREKARANWLEVHKHGRLLDRARSSAPTFRQATEEVIALHAPTWKAGSKTERLWRSSLEQYVHPRLGNQPIDTITTGDLLDLLAPLAAKKSATATALQQRIGAVMKWSEAQGHREHNPVDSLAGAMPKSRRQTENRRALPHAEVAGALAKVRESGAWIGTRLCLEFMALTACRSSEARGAAWDEIATENRVWTIPPQRMKAGREHRIPLSDAALRVLDTVREMGFMPVGPIFPSVRGKTLSDSLLSDLVRKLGIKGTPHGLRTSFRSWAAECSDAPREVCELALAHVNKDRVEAAYMRSDLFERRRGLMRAWARYLES